MVSPKTAGVILIGNELLSGRTPDENLAYIARELGEKGIVVGECRIIPDREQTIIETVNHFRTTFDFVFTTGGIGPTHDDITCHAVAKAFDVPVVRDDEVAALFKKHYGERATPETFRMADFPKGAELLNNAASIAPGFKVENVFVLAGVPRIMQSMFEAVRPHLPQGSPVRSLTYTAHTSESKISKRLEAVQQEHPQVEIGSYPFLYEGKPAVSLVIKGFNVEALQKAGGDVLQLLADVDAQMIAEPELP